MVLRNLQNEITTLDSFTKAPKVGPVSRSILLAATGELRPPRLSAPKELTKLLEKELSR